MSEQQAKTCEYPGPHGQSCFLLEGHKGRHRAASVFEWNSGEPAFNLTRQEAREAAAFRALRDNLWKMVLSPNIGRWLVMTMAAEVVAEGRTALEAVEAAMRAQAKPGKPVAKAKCARCGGSGRRQVDVMNFELTTCPEWCPDCNGTGEAPAGAEKETPR